MTPPRIVLASDEVHLWFVSLQGSAEQRAIAHALLDEAEQTQAARFHFDRDRFRFIFAHAALRRVLARVLEVAPPSLRFTKGPAGKPSIASATPAPLHFNLSHAHEYALIGLSRDYPIGVDLEWSGRDVEYNDIVSRFFSTIEKQAWAALAPSEFPTAFFRAWTRKEAYVKARGAGLGHASENYSVDFSPAGAGGLIADELDPTAPDRFQLHPIVAPDGYNAAWSAEVTRAKAMRVTLHKTLI
ncbi:4'-phosphopantetheinyl transferase family protein [Synoicihabitans lomoniglobus]|uniref:4'-phosphopantetheinyl transferase superfamily protein n=1 Tax=Synoicihabitans lomoniglobus TaxID=2909285 RepID=A0AAE9ZX10_9BACT|nr:4'-phosphopantetheinyl transferase superfamily protein [Opitutaceae bacterium LMO-M01]WED65712.1 4'-phosphopantetheinyl transferase superfamily protein [Opitutaceae bacterium LMO-M01]